MIARSVVIAILVSSAARAQPETEPTPATEPAAEPPVEPATEPVVEPAPQPEPEPAAAPAPAASAPLQVIFRPGIWIYGEYRAELPQGADWNHVFDLGRGWAWMGFELGDARARILLEGVRGSGEGSLFGVGGDSLVLRLREAWAGYRFFELVELRAGLVPQLMAQSLLDAWDLQAISQAAATRFDVLQPADLGVNMRMILPQNFGSIGAGAYNGEGYRSRELNRGKSVEIFADVHPFAFIPEVRPLAILIGYQNGSEGTGLARADRFLGGIAWIDPRFGAGATASWVGGYQQRDQDGALLEAWVRGRPWEGLILAGRIVHFIRDLAANGDALTEVTLAAGYRMLEVVSAYAAVDGRFAGETARSALPGYEEWRIRVIAEARFEGDLRWTP